MKNSAKRVRAVMSLTVVAAFALGACSSSTKTTSSGATGSTGSTSSASSSAGNAANAKLPPVKVGFHNPEGGALSMPDVRMGFEAGVKYVNDQLGGINGHPLTYEVCNTDVTPESSVNCANKFVTDNVVMAVQGLDVMGDAALPVLKEANIVDVGSFAYGPAQDTTQGQFYGGWFSIEEGYAATLVQLHNMGAKSVVFLLLDIPNSHAAEKNVLDPVAKQLGIKLSTQYFKQGGDWATTAATTMTSNPDAVAVYGADADCLGAIPALRGAGFTGTLDAGGCVTFASKLAPSMLKNVINNNAVYTDQMSPIPDAVKNDLAVYDKYIAAYPKVASAQYAEQGFFTAVWAADLLRQIPGDPITAKAVYDNIGKAKGSRLFFRTTGYDCSQPTWPGTTACGGGYIISKVTSDGKFEVLPDQPVDVSGVRTAGN